MAKNKEEKNKKFDIPLVALLVLPTVVFFLIYFLYCEKSDVFFKISSESYIVRCEEFYAIIDNNKSNANAKAESRLKDFESKKENLSQKFSKQDTINSNNPNQEIKDYDNPTNNIEENKNIEENSSASTAQSTQSRPRANQGKGSRTKRKNYPSNFDDILNDDNDDILNYE